MADSEPRTWPKLPLKHRVILALYRLGQSASKLLRINFMYPKVPPSPTIPIKGVTTSDFTIDPTKDLWFRLFTPVSTSDNNNNLPFIVYYHGGGFIISSPDAKHFDDFCRTLAREVPAVVASANYRLAPQFRCPTAYEDGFDALKYFDGEEFRKTCLQGKADLKKCFISGDSAGGNLAHHVVVNASEYNFNDIQICGLIAFQPFFGGEERTESEIHFIDGPVLTLEAADGAWKSFLPEGSDRNHPAAHVFGPNGKDISGLDFPNTLLFIGGCDPLQDWQRKYLEWLKKSGTEVNMIEYPTAFHGFYVVSDLPEAGMAVKEVRDFVEKQVSQMGKET